MARVSKPSVAPVVHYDIFWKKEYSEYFATLSYKESQAAQEDLQEAAIARYPFLEGKDFRVIEQYTNTWNSLIQAFQ